MDDSAPSAAQKTMAYIHANRHRIIPFLVVGGTAFLVNWGLFKLFRVAGMTSRPQVFGAFLISMELSILCNFALQYQWTWKDTQRLRGWSLFMKLAAFHGAVGAGAVFRMILFPIGQVLRIQDDLNLMIGVGAATFIDFLLYDRVVFKKAPH